MQRPRLVALTIVTCVAAWALQSWSGVMARSEQPAAAVPENVEAGVPLTLARERAARVSDVRYDLQFFVPLERTEAVRGEAVIRFRLTDASTPLALDFAGTLPGGASLDVNGQAAPAVARDEHILLPATALRPGENVVRVPFQSSDLALNRQPEFLYTLFVPARSRLAFPCFDQPDLKARYSLRLDAPAAWETLSNGAITARSGSGDRVRVTFGETQPIPTYLFAFAAGRFSVETAERNGRTLRMLHRETDAAKVARNREAVFDLHAAALGWLENYTGIPYPFGKFDFLLVPSFQFGGMEHPGAIFYNASSILLDPSATQNQKLGRASLIAHETAHMWFGDLVTMRWFDDVWMKEVFANFMAAKIVNPSFPEINHDLRFLYAHYPAAYDVDRTAGSNAIRQRLDNLNEAGSLYGAIIYQKAPIVMRQLEMIVTPDGLRDGLRDYLKAHAFGNAAWPDLIALLDARTPQDLAAWSQDWVETVGRPSLRVEANADHDRFVIFQGEPSAPPRWPQRLHVEYGRGARLDSVAVDITANASLTLAGPGPRSERSGVDFLLPTGRGVGYGDVELDPRSRAYLTSHLADVPDALTRGAALVTLWEEMLGGRVTPVQMFDAIVSAVPRESDELTVARMLGYLQQDFWKFLPEDERHARAASTEALLRAGLDAAPTQSLKSAWFNALRDTAVTPPTLAWLQRVWDRSTTVPGLTLAEPDFITLALELAVRAVPEWRQILETQAGRIENPDRKAQFQFVRPALSADAREREAFFATLADVQNRRREPWVLQAVGYMNHPLRAAAHEPQIDRALAMLREIQRTGDIFFPKRWADATLSGHRSASAARRVRQFLESVPEGYPERLRRIVLSSSDDLFRASRSRER